jgi:alkylhydroperoxidase family enzyme
VVRPPAVAALERLRAVVARRPAPPPAMEPYLEKVRERAYSVTDADVQELKRAGLREDEIFEQTVAVAIAEGLRRLDAGVRTVAR